MVQDIVFHLGDCKTGTTSIQSVLAAGGVKSEAEILYTARFNHIPLAKTLSDENAGLQRKARFLKLRRALVKSDAPHAVISAEHFEFVDPEALDTALRQYMPGLRDQIRLIAYVRPHADRLVSTFAERAKKGGFMKDMPALHKRMLENGALMYTPRFEKWRQLFGDRFTLRPFVRDQMAEGDVVKDFLSYVLGNRSFDVAQPAGQNESLSVTDIAMMRFMHKILRNMDVDLRDQQQSLGWFMSDYLAALPRQDGEKPRLHVGLAEKVVKAYREDAAALDAAFFEGTPMSNALEQAPSKAVEQAQSFDPEDHFSEAERRRLTAIAQMFGHVIASDPRHFLWAVRPEEQRSEKPPRGRGNRALDWWSSANAD